MEQLQIGKLSLTWLRGGNTHLDGGAMFGVVPKPLWSTRYPCNERNQIELRTDPILIQKDGLHILVDSGIGQDKLDEKQRRNFGVTEQSSMEESLKQLGLSATDIDYVLLTHLHFDHASGLTKREGERFIPTFPKAKHVMSQQEWDEMRAPNIRSRNTYWKNNWESIVSLVTPFQGEVEIAEGIKLIHTGGHSAGHAILQLESEGVRATHFGDLMPTHAHQNPLWVLAYDDYPMDSIFAKEKWVKQALEEERWVTFYHDAYYRAVRWDKNGQLLEAIPRVREELKENHHE